MGDTSNTVATTSSNNFAIRDKMVRKHKIALFINAGNSGRFIRIKKSTALTITMNPKEETYDYIADESPTTEIVQYKPAIDQEIVMYKGEEDYEAVFPYFYEQRTGSAAHVEAMIVFMQEGTPEEGYKAWKTDAILSIQNLSAVDKKLKFKITFGGTTKKGIAVVKEGVPTFAEKSTNI